MRKYAYVCFFCLFLFVILAIGIGVNDNLIYMIDNDVFNFVLQNKNSFLDQFYVIITYLGEFYTIFIILIVLYMFPSRKRIAFPLTIITGISFLINALIKVIIARPSPSATHISNISFGFFQFDYSFPSTQSQISFVFYVSLIILLICYYGKVKKTFPYIIILAILFFGNFAFSRVYLGFEYPIDCLCGLLLGFAIIFLVLGIVSSYPTFRIVNVVIDHPKGTSDLDFRSILYKESFGYVSNYYKKNGKYMRCYFLGDDENGSVNAYVVALIIRTNDLENILVTASRPNMLRKKDIIERVSFIEDEYEEKIIML